MLNNLTSSQGGVGLSLRGTDFLLTNTLDLTLKVIKRVFNYQCHMSDSRIVDVEILNFTTCKYNSSLMKGSIFLWSKYSLKTFQHFPFSNLFYNGKSKF